MKKYPKACPACGSKKITKLDTYGMRCNKCGYMVLRKAPEGAGFKKIGVTDG